MSGRLLNATSSQTVAGGEGIEIQSACIRILDEDISCGQITWEGHVHDRKPAHVFHGDSDSEWHPTWKPQTPQTPIQILQRMAQY